MTRLFSLYRSRINIVSIMMLSCSVLILGKMFYIQTFQSSGLRETTQEVGITERSVRGQRGEIFDRQENVLAETIHTYTFWVNTNQEIDKEEIIDQFSDLFIHSPEHYRRLLIPKKSYSVIAQGLRRSECEPILRNIKNIQGLNYDVSVSRYYPYNNLLSQVIGYVDRDGKGHVGVEQEFDAILIGKKTNVLFDRSADGRLRKSFREDQPEVENGADIMLTVDVKFQAILLDALKQGMKRSGAKTANGVIINPYSGDILAMASVPDFDPNEYWNFDMSSFPNRVITDSYEPGSTFKLVSMTAVLESGYFHPTDIFFCENGEYQITSTKIIHDHEPHGDLNLAEIFIYSSNIGLIKLIDQMGPRFMYDYARKFGFGICTGVALAGETPGVLREFGEWTRLSGPFVSMGQEISINTLQLALAYSAAANGGYLPNARIIKKISGSGFDSHDYSPKPVRRVMSTETSQSLLSMMEDVVISGTANKARIPGFRIGGKTGTAEKFIDGKYSKREFISSFAAVFPIDNPKYVCVVSVDSPQYGYHWGNETAAPIVKEIFERLIINNDREIPVTRKNIPQFADKNKAISPTNLLSTAGVVEKDGFMVPNFLGKTLKQSLQEAKQLGLEITPVGTSGRVVWQSASPGQLVSHINACTIKLESM